MPQALQFHQREKLREGLLRAGISDAMEGEYAFLVEDVRVDAEKYTVAFCHTAYTVTINACFGRSNFDPNMFSESIGGTPDLPETSGPCAVLGLIKVVRSGTEKPVLHITLLHYVPSVEAEDAYEELLVERGEVARFTLSMGEFLTLVW